MSWDMGSARKLWNIVRFQTLGKILCISKIIFLVFQILAEPRSSSVSQCSSAGQHYEVCRNVSPVYLTPQKSYKNRPVTTITRSGHRGVSQIIFFFYSKLELIIWTFTRWKNGFDDFFKTLYSSVCE